MSILMFRLIYHFREYQISQVRSLSCAISGNVPNVLFFVRTATPAIFHAAPTSTYCTSQKEIAFIWRHHALHIN